MEEKQTAYKFNIGMSENVDDIRQTGANAIAFLLDQYGLATHDSENEVEGIMHAINTLSAALGYSIGFDFDYDKADEEWAADSFIVVDLRSGGINDGN